MTDSSFDRAFAQVALLCENFAAYQERYLAPGYSESQARTDFIDKFLTALGWDVGHLHQQNPFEQEVKVEKNVDVGPAQKRADYALFVAPNFRDVRLYIEAKKPIHSIATPDNFFQAIRYGWNSSTPLAVLTDFHSLHILDCRYRPDIDTALDRSVFRYGFRDYQNKDKFAEIYWLISREALQAGSIDKRAAELPKYSGKQIQKRLFKGGYQRIDDAFLEDLDLMREMLARVIKRDYIDLDGDTLTEITQRVLDRLVFLRFLEDKLIETDERVSKFGDKGNTWREFVTSCRRLDLKYNGTVFKHHQFIDDEKRFKVDNAVFGDICNELGDSTSPYDFNAIPIHILGSIYERFLGRVIVATAKRVRLEEKPEVRRAGGVYYTPEYIVRHIVDNSVGKLIETKTPADIAAMRFADISCGSGSFLLGIFDCVIRQQTKWYNSQKNERARFLKQGVCIADDNGLLHLSLRSRREILLQNIYGIDIDNQAVEVAHLSLYLKLLEDETTSSARQYQREMGIALLPSLTGNVVCGNSLVETDFLDADDLFDSDKSEERKLNPMDFKMRFPNVFTRDAKTTGFAAIVGNPPYGADLNKLVKKYLHTKYPAVADFETSQFFISRANDLLRDNGCLAFIVPNTLVLNTFAKRFRVELLTQFDLNELLDLSNVEVFSGATVRTVVPILYKKNSAKLGRNKQKIDEAVFISVDANRNVTTTRKVAFDELKRNDDAWRTTTTGEGKLISKIRKLSIPLNELLEVSQGLIPYDKYRGHSEHTIKNRVWHSNTKKDGTYRKELRGGDVTRYKVIWNGEQWISYGDWLAAPRKPAFFREPRLLFREITDPKSGLLHVAYTDKEYYNNPGIINCIVRNPKDKHSLFYLLGLCNSKLMAYLHFSSSPKARKGVFPKILVDDVRKLPIRQIHFDQSEEATFHSQIVKNVERMIELKIQADKTVTEKDYNYYQRRALEIDNKIDTIVYRLYELTAEEIETIENKIQPGAIGGAPAASLI